MKRFVRWLSLVFCLAVLPLPAYAISTEEEIRIGREAAARFEQAHGLVNDRAMVARLDRIAKSMLPHVERTDLPWRFRIIDVNAFNAAAFPGGFIYVTKGLMNGLTDEEVAFVVGHEMAHAEHRHSVRQLEQAQRRRLGLIAIAIGLTGGNVDERTATLIQLADGVIGSQHSQSAETESDRTGMRLMAAAGYDPVFGISALQKLGEQSSGGTPGFLNTLLGSHPLPRERVRDGQGQVFYVPYRVNPEPPVYRGGGGSVQALHPGAAESLEYTLSLLGHGHLRSLQRQAEELASRGGAPPRGAVVVRVNSPRSGGVTALENRLLSRPELGEAQGKRQFGLAVRDLDSERIEAVLLLGGGR